MDPKDDYLNIWDTNALQSNNSPEISPNNHEFDVGLAFQAQELIGGCLASFMGTYAYIRWSKLISLTPFFV